MQIRRFNVIPGMQYGTPKEIWGFRTRPRRGAPHVLAENFIANNADLLGSRRVGLRRVREIESLGAHHVIFQQRLHGLPIQRAYLTVHMGKNGSIYLVKNRVVPHDYLAPAAEFVINMAAARRRALLSVASRSKSVRIVASEKLWFPLKSILRPAYRVRIEKRKPRGDWVVFVDGETGRILRKFDNLSEAVFVRIFDPNPVIALRSARKLVNNGKFLVPPDNAYVRVSLRGLRKTGSLDGQRVSTSLTRRRVDLKRDDLKFASDNPRFEEVMTYFHIDRAIGYLESLGFRGSRAIFRDPLAINANGTDEDNSWYSPHDRSITFGLGGVDDAEDAEIILHEFGHAIQDAICPGFGQSQEAAAMGEGFGDYFATSFFAEKKPRRYQTSFGTWDGVEMTEFDPPCVRRVDLKLTYESFDHGETADEHDNGQIWSATLWDVRRALGRDIADRIILESHFQLDGFTTFARGARAIIDADRNLYRGRNAEALRRVFRRRGIGPVE